MGNHSPNQADPVGLGGIDGVCGPDQLQRLLRADDAGQEVGAAGAGEQTDFGEYLGERGPFRSDPDIAGAGNVETAAGGDAVDGCNDRFFDLADGHDHALGAT